MGRVRFPGLLNHSLICHPHPDSCVLRVNMGQHEDWIQLYRHLVGLSRYPMLMSCSCT